MPHSVFPLTISTLAEVRISVNADDADEARRIIESHRTELPGGRVVRLRDEFDLLQQAIGYRFRDVGLLEHAMTHTSRANEDVSGGVVDNESLEFLGDAVLGFAIADQLFREFPEFDEGQKSKTKAALVSTAALARQAERLGLGDHLLLGRGEEKTGGRRKQALLADGYEALIAAIYLDGGIEQARAFIAREFAPLLDDDQPARPDRPRPQVVAAGIPAVARLPAAGVPGGRHARPRSSQAVSGRGGGARRGDRRGDRTEQEGGGAGSGAGGVGEIRNQELANRISIRFRNSSLVDLDNPPRLLVLVGGRRRRRRPSPAPAPAARQARQGVAVHLAREVVLAGRRHAAMEPDPDAQQRIGEAVALLARRHQIHVLEPREVVLRRPGRALQPVRNLGEREALPPRRGFRGSP